MRPEEMTGRLLVALGATCVTLAAASPFSPHAAGPRPAADRRPVPILMYHVIADPPRSAPSPTCTSRVENSPRRRRCSRRLGEAVSLSLVLDAWHGRATLPPRPMVLSFDDGYRSQVTAARPILATRRWPGVLNLDLSNLTPSWGVGRAGSGGQWPLVGRSIARSLTHPDLTALHAATLKREVAGSRAVIRRRFGVSARFFCYPSERCGNLPRSASPRRLSGNSSPARPP